MLVAAAVIAVVSLITFGVLLDGLQNQGRSAVKARAANDAVTQAGVLERIALDMQNSVRGFMLTGDRAQLAPFERARAEVPKAGEKLISLEIDAGPRAQVKALNGQLAAYAEYLGGVIDAPAADTAATARETERRLQGFRTELDAFEAAERAEQMRLRAAGTTLRNRATRIAAVGLVVLLALIALLAFGAVRAIVGPVDRLQRFARELGRRALRAPACPRRARRRRPSSPRAFNLSAENLQRETDRHLAELDAVFRDSPLGIAF